MRGIIEPCLFTRPDGLVYVVHVDDFATTGPLAANQAMLLSLQEVMLLKCSDPLAPGDSSIADPIWHSFLSRERCWLNDCMMKRVSPKFVNESVVLLGLEAANPTSVPGVKFMPEQVEDKVELP